jgi:PadR family transcriptional regulator, regulatory protein PadR
MAKKQTNPSFMNGVPEMAILKLLSRKEMYGYEIVKSIQEASQNMFSFGEGCVYPILHYLGDEKLVESQSQVINGRNRITYKITASGKQRLTGLSDEWNRISTGISHIWEFNKKQPNKK